MQNRRERRAAEKAMGFHKIEKAMSADEKKVLKDRKREYVKQMLLMQAQEAENRKNAEEAEKWSKSLETWMADGKTREEAEAILLKNKEVSDKRKADLEMRKKRREHG
jgi:hypothetical protein